MGNTGSAKDDHNDLVKYRAGYPGLQEYPDYQDNYLFYSGKKALPSGEFIDQIHTNWWGKVASLERQSDIQLLFPVRDSDASLQHKPLQKHEIEKIKSDKDCYHRLFKSYEMILDLYGCRIKNQETGEIERNDSWEECYKYLDSHKHNNVTITQLLKCLGEFDLQKYQIQFIKHFVEEIYANHKLFNYAASCMYWIWTIKDDLIRQEFEKKIPRMKKNTLTVSSAHSRLISSSRITDEDDEESSDLDSDIIIDPSDKEAMLRDDDDMGEYTKVSVEEEETGSRKEDDIGDKEDDIGDKEDE